MNTYMHFANLQDLRLLQDNAFIRQQVPLLPKIEVKPFDGNPFQWRSFHDTFKTLVHDN